MQTYMFSRNILVLFFFFPRTQAPVMLLAIFVLLTSALNAQAQQPCNAPGPIGFFGLSEKQMTIHVRKDTPCTVTFGRVPFAFFQQTVIKRPRGIYGVSNKISGAYQPPKGYVGDDYFEVRLRYQKLGVGQEKSQTTLKITASITE